MKLKPTLSALMIAAIPMAVQAGQASVLTMQLNAPLSTSSQTTLRSAEEHVPMMDFSGAIENDGNSTTMAKARANLNGEHRDRTGVELTGAPLRPSRNATK